MKAKLTFALALLGLVSALCLKGMELAGEKLQKRGV
jgi:hypothetical protein